MSDSALEFAEERGLGQVLGRVRLGSGLAGAGGARSRATLLLSTSGLWLVAARDRFHGEQVDLLTRGDLRLESGRLRDRLCFGQEQLTIPAGRRGAVERLIGLGRLGIVGAVPSSPFEVCRSLSEPDELGRAWLTRQLAPGEVLLTWLRGANREPLRSHLIGDTLCPPYLFVTERRAALVAWSAVGDVSYTPLNPETTRQTNADERPELNSAEGRFLSRRSDARACRDAFELLGMPAGKARLLEAARRTWLARDRSRDEAAHCSSLLDTAIDEGVSARALPACSRAPGKASRRGPLTVRRRTQRSARGRYRRLRSVICGSISAFRSLPQPPSFVGCSKRAHQPYPSALALQRRAHTEPSADEGIARDELALARYAVEARLSSAARPDERDLALQRVLAPHGLGAAPAPVLATLEPLAPAAIEDELTHPLARGQGSLVAGAQKLIAQSPEPDPSALSDYCEALDGRAQPEAKRALDAARTAFSLPNLHAYVSRGKKAIGLRGYEGKAPYILLGQAHLDPASPYRMSEAELYFAIGAEALHLKLGQARLTSHEVWAGAFAHTRGGVELALGVLPLLKGLPLVASVSKFLDKIPEPALRRGLEALMRLEHTRKPLADATAPPSALSLVNENLVAAHRVMQMSADRAGLLLSGDLRSSLRGLLLVRPDTYAVLERIAARDLTSVLLDHENEAESAMRADLIVRVAALIEFFGSEAYPKLRRALGGT